jgi:hypothetical protein
VHGLEPVRALLAFMPGCVGLLYEYALDPQPSHTVMKSGVAVPGGHATAHPIASTRFLSRSGGAGGGGGAAGSGLALVDHRRGASAYRRISLLEIREVAKRRYQLQPWAVQLLLGSGEAVLLSVEGGEPARDELYARIVARVPRAAATDSSDDGGWSRGLWKHEAAQYTEAWQAGRSSNFEYLMQLNHLAGRCYDDLMQYPVFPWVVRANDAATLNLRDSKTFRDLSKPMGAQTEARASMFQDRYAEWDSGAEGIPPFHYGTHYSSAAAVSSHLLRLEPFTSYHCSLQDGRFDLADRLFHSLAEEWKLASGEKGSDTGCVKELVPEAFYLPEALLNLNDAELGRRQDGASLNHVMLPLWARGSAWRCVRGMRQALECAHASNSLPLWIDLVFGCLQQGPGAAEALNVFLYSTYVGGVELEKLPASQRTALLAQIQLVGQTPEQLWSDRRHPPRTATAIHSMPLGPLFTALGSAQPLASTVERPPAMTGGGSGFAVRALLLTAGGERGVPLGACAVAVPKSQLVLRWGYSDGSLRYFATKGAHGAPAALLVARPHGGTPIHAACVSADAGWLVTGDAHGALAVWRQLLRGAATPKLQLHAQLAGHSAPVLHLACSGQHRLIASASKDGALLLWDLRQGLLLHVLVPAPSPAPPPPAAPAGAAGLSGLRGLGGGALSALCVLEETAETLLATSASLQLWSANGALLAVSACSFPPATALLGLNTPEWMVEHLPIAASGHADGSLRFWAVREPPDSAASLGATFAAAPMPRALSRLPLRATDLPAWELHEIAALRLEPPSAEAPAVTAIHVGEGYEKLLWAADEEGCVRSWRLRAESADDAA